MSVLLAKAWATFEQLANYCRSYHNVGAVALSRGRQHPFPVVLSTLCGLISLRSSRTEQKGSMRGPWKRARTLEEGTVQIQQQGRLEALTHYSLQPG